MCNFNKSIKKNIGIQFDIYVNDSNLLKSYVTIVNLWLCVTTSVYDLGAFLNYVFLHLYDHQKHNSTRGKHIANLGLLNSLSSATTSFIKLESLGGDSMARKNIQ